MELNYLKRYQISIISQYVHYGIDKDINIKLTNNDKHVEN